MDVTVTTLVSPSCSGSGSSSQSQTAKKKPMRRDPEKRRQQNLQAQKKYREKLKKRLDQLQQLEAITDCIAKSCGDSNISVLGSECGSPQYQAPGAPNGREGLCFTMDTNIFKPFATSSTSEDALWDPQPTISPSQLIHGTTTIPRSPYYISYLDCGCPSYHLEISGSSPKSYRILKEALEDRNISIHSITADPYINAIRIERLCLIQAIFANCAHIGITEDFFCDDDAISPFYRPGGGLIGSINSENAVNSTQDDFHSLKLDVRPTREQITTLHHPVIDVLPFPTLRKNLISQADVVDEDELCDDLLNGLMCWSGAGLGKRDRDCSTGSVSTGTPWDGRSWEGRTWFLKKYWALLGGEEGELVRQSEWWRSTRGEETELWLEV